MQIRGTAIPCDGDLITTQRFRFIMKRLRDVADEMNQKLEGLLAVGKSTTTVVDSLRLYVAISQGSFLYQKQKPRDTSTHIIRNSRNHTTPSSTVPRQIHTTATRRIILCINEMIRRTEFPRCRIPIIVRIAGDTRHRHPRA